MEDKRQETDSHECENDMPALRVGYYDWNLDTNAMCWSAEFYEILGLTGQNIVPNYQRFIARFHPEDRIHAHDLIFLAHDLGHVKARPCRVVDDTGAVRTVHLSAERELDAAGHVIRLRMTLDTLYRPKING